MFISGYEIKNGKNPNSNILVHSPNNLSTILCKTNKNSSTSQSRIRKHSEKYEADTMARPVYHNSKLTEQLLKNPLLRTSYCTITACNALFICCNEF